MPDDNVLSRRISNAAAWIAGGVTLSGWDAKSSVKCTIIW